MNGTGDVLWSSFWTTNRFCRWKENVDVNDEQQTMPIGEERKKLLWNSNYIGFRCCCCHFHDQSFYVMQSNETCLINYKIKFIYTYLPSFAIDSKTLWFVGIGIDFNLIEIMYTKPFPSPFFMPGASFFKSIELIWFLNLTFECVPNDFVYQTMRNNNSIKHFYFFFLIWLIERSSFV